MPEDLLETALAEGAAPKKGARPEDVPEKFWTATPARSAWTRC